MALSSHPRNASLKARPWALAYGLSILCARGRFGAYLCSSFPHLSRTTERSVGNLRQRVQSCGLDAETGQWKEIRHFVRRRVAKNGCVSFISGKKKNNAIRLEFFGVSSERNLLEGAVDSPERTAEDEASGETVAVDVTQSTAAESDGDLSDCPPGLREFVFAPPHPFPLTVDPEFLEPEDVREVVRALLGDERTSQAKGSPKIASVWCTGESAHSGSDWRWLQYPEPNALWPNPLLHNHRLQPLSCVIPSERPGHANEEPRAEAERPENVDQLQAHLNSTRLQKLWKYSKVHGISWDELDDMYIQYRERQKERQQRWNDHKQQLLHYAGQVCARRLRAERTEYFKQRGVDLQGADEGARDALLQPRSLFRRMTRRLFYMWHDAYFNPWSPGGLQSVLRAHITLRMLQRETNERFLHMKGKWFSPESGHVSMCDESTDVDDSTLQPFSKVGTSVERVKEVLRRRSQNRKSSNQGPKESQNPYVVHQQFPTGAEGDQQGRPWDFSGVGRREKP